MSNYIIRDGVLSCIPRSNFLYFLDFEVAKEIFLIKRVKSQATVSTSKKELYMTSDVKKI